MRILLKACSENKVLSGTGLKYALEVATALEAKGFGSVVKEGSQYYFHINQDELFSRYEEIGVKREVSYSLITHRILQKNSI